MSQRSRRAVQAFLARAREKIGSQRALAAHVSAYGPDYHVERAAVGHWIRGTNPNAPPAWVVFALGQDLGLRLDAFAFGDEGDPVAQDIADLDGRVTSVERLLSRLLIEAAQRGWDTKSLSSERQ